MSNILKRIINPSARGKVWWVFVLIIALVVSSALVDIGGYYNKGVDALAVKTGNKITLPHTKEVNFRLGLDLLGGTHLVYKAEVDNIPSKDVLNAVEGVRDVIERRVNVFGVSEPIVQVNRSNDEYRIIVELAGIKDVNEAIKMIGETPLLEFKEASQEKRSLTEEERNNMNEYNKEAERRAEDVLGKVLSGGDFGALAQEFSEDDKTKDSGGDLGWVSKTESPEIVASVEKMQVGKNSRELIERENGFEILKLEDKRIRKNAFTNEDEKEVRASHLLICFKGADRCDSEMSKEDAYKKIEELKSKARVSNFTSLVKANSTEPGANERGGDLGWFGAGAMVKPFEDVVFAQKIGTISDIVETQFGYHLIYKKDERKIDEYKIRAIFIGKITESDILGSGDQWQNTELTGKNLKRAIVQFDQNDNAPEVSLEFDDEGSKLFEQVTERNIGKPVAIFLDNYPISIPNVNEKITGGKAVISGNFDIKEAKLLAQRLNAGALPVPISLISQQTVGASLGHKSVENSLRAGVIGVILVALFMIVYYRLPGIIAVFSLGAYGLLVLAVFKLWPVTLTLAGVAGFILSIGMAVDANVLIFERLKEELRKGKPVGMAIEEGFKRAWPSIRDGNISTLITCFILIQFSTSIIKGFAITLGLGIVISMFSAIIITRNFINLLSGKWVENKPWLFGVKKK